MAKTKKTTPQKQARAPRTTSANAALLAAIATATAHMKAVQAELVAAGLGGMSADDREHSTGKLRVAEPDAMVKVLDTVDAYPALFQSIADKDHGEDDAVVETQPARDALTERAALAPLAQLGAAVAQLLNDAVLERGEIAKDVTGPAYKIITANAPLNAAVAKRAAGAITFYGKSAKKGAATRKKKARSPTP